MKVFTIIFALFVLIGCATTQEEVYRYVGPQPQEYNEGFQAGCDSGNAAAGNPYYKFKKDVRRHNSDELYRTGWDDGFNYCKEQNIAIDRILLRR